jgi:outer membrane protein assembly factor BamB
MKVLLHKMPFLVLLILVSCQQNIPGKSGFKQVGTKGEIVLPFKNIIWDFNLRGEIVKDLWVLSDYLILETNSNNIYAINRLTGVPKWTWKIDTNFPLEFSPLEVLDVVSEIHKVENRIGGIDIKIRKEKEKKEPDFRTIDNLQKEYAKLIEELKKLSPNDNLYVISRDTLYAIDRHSGIVQWKRYLRFIPSSRPFIAKGNIFIPSLDNNKVYSIGIGEQPGKEVFYNATIHTHRVKTSPIFENNRLYFVTEEGVLHSYNTANQELDWKIELGGYVDTSPLKYREEGVPVENAREFLFVASRNYSIYALSTDGTLIWKYEVGDRIKSPLFAISNILIAITQKNKLLALDVNPVHGTPPGPKRSGNLKWELSGVEKVILRKDNLLYLLTTADSIREVDIITGKTIDEYPVKNLYFIPENLYDEILYAGTVDGRIFAMRSQ